MADQRIDIDVSKALADIAQMKGGLHAVVDEIFRVGKSADAAFGKDFGRGMADGIEELKREYGELKKSADILKGALRTATDPGAIKIYARSIAELEVGMKELEKSGKAAGVNLKAVNKEAGTGKQVFEGLFGTFTKVTLILAAIEAVRKFVAYSVNLSQEISKAQRSFEAFTGSATGAKKIVDSLIATGAAKFVDSAEILKAGKALLAFGENADELPDVLGRIADVSAATGKDFNELALIYGKARTAGVLYAEDINQLVDAGIPIIQEFAKQMGVTEGQIKKLASEGKISFEELQLAMFNLTAEGGKFANQSEIQVFTISGAYKKLVAELAPVFQTVGDFFSAYIQRALNTASEFVSDVKSLFGDEKPKLEVDYTGRDAYEAAKEDLYERERLEKEAERARRERNKKNSAEAAKLEKERSKLILEAMLEGEAKEIAAENLRFKELSKQLKKFHIDTQQAEQQHQINLGAISAKYAIERAQQELELIEMRKERAEYEYQQSEKQFDDQKKNLEERLAIRQSEIDITEERSKTFVAVLKDGNIAKRDVEKAELALDKEVTAARIQALIDFNEAYLSILGEGKEGEAEIVRNKIQSLKAALEGVAFTAPKGKKPGDKAGLLDLIGIDLSDKEIEGLEKFADQIKSILSDLADAEVEAAERAIEAAKKKTDAAQTAYDKEKELNEQGFANNLDLAARALESAKAEEAKAQAQKERAIKRQQQLDTVLQVSSLVTASAQTLAQFPGPLLPIGIALVAAMFGAFLAAKIRAKQASKFRHGGEGRVDANGFVVGASHEQGGVAIEAEGGEMFATDGKRFAIVNKEMSARHFDLLKAVNANDKQGMRRALERIVPPTINTVGALAAVGVSDVSAKPNGAHDAKTYSLLKEQFGKPKKTVTVEGDWVVEREGSKTRRRRIQK